ncbi:hypothetical protein ACFXG1_14525 [Streptomyces sp. NPDC059248]|uniref:hypothetical protein n=1 Tax=Streptomyces sp. NPDC059248 TaxID=3346791 RepID=UPI003689021B
MRIRTALAALALVTASVASVAGTATTAAAANEFGDIIITTGQHTDFVAACNEALLVLSPSVQCGIFDIAPQ